MAPAAALGEAVVVLVVIVLESLANIMVIISRFCLFILKLSVTSARQKSQKIIN
jgi:hypothetical protein